MKPLSFATRGARWLMAAGLSVAFLTSPVFAQADAPVMTLEKPGTTGPNPGELQPFFEKTGRQRDCNYVTYRLRFGVRGAPTALADAAGTGLLSNLRMDFADQMPNGLTVVNVQATGDGTDSGGGALPAPTIGATADPNDTARLDDFRLSSLDLDGSGELSERYISIVITAKIDAAAFPAPMLIDNQGNVRVQRPGGAPIDLPSHDPALPDDGNYLTGAKTSIAIDLTGCNPPPPPPGGEECFKVETGTVDCVPGGGAFIYHMPVGADMAGKYVQIRTTTPGVTVAPGPQLVPAGGGILNWTITGASSGDVVHLIVTGIETYAGEKDGVGLCCTQTIDLVIPADLKCPPKEKQPDINIQKRADVPSCTLEGGCAFTITVSNAGDGPYNGKIVLDEVTLPGNATIDSGPNAPWVCAPLTSPMTCTHPVTTLNPGASIDLKIGFKPGPGWNWPGIRNCATYKYADSGKPAFGNPGNDRACASIPICIPGRDRACTPPVEKKVDLGIQKKAARPVCSADGVCLFIINVVNTGTETINGPLTVSDTYPSGIPASTNFVPSPPWSCAPSGPGQFRCDHPGVVLVPGASIALGVKSIIGPDYTADSLENCAEVTPVSGETNLANNKACAKIRVPHRNPGKPALRITKTCDGAVAGAAVSCRITVISVGDAAPSGPVRVSDAATILGGATPVQIQTVSPDGPEWNCTAVPTDALSCVIPGETMTPGTSRYFDVTLNVAANQRFENCARGSYGPAPGNDIVYPISKACHQGGSTIRVEKTGDRQCQLGAPCTFQITITNDGDSAFSGPVRIGDALGVEGLGRLEGVPVSSIEPPFGCSPEPSVLPLSCETNLSLGAGENRVHTVTVVIPDDDRFANQNGDLAGRNCVAVLSPNTPVTGEGAGSVARALTGEGDKSGDAYSCHPFTIVKQRVEKQCSEGFVMNDSGRCVCPEGTAFRNGQCVGDTGVVPVPPRKKPEPQCKLLPGQIRTQEGACVCPRGTELTKGVCRKVEQPPVRQCKLLPGQIRTQEGKCICPRGTELKNGACRKVEQPPVRQCKLLPGQIRTQEGKCICPRGTELANGACRKRQVECPKGTRLENGTCVRIPREIQCRRGQVVRNGKCVTVTIERRCPQGTVGNFPDCRSVERVKPRREIDPNLVNPDTLRKLLQRRDQSGDQQQPRIRREKRPQVQDQDNGLQLRDNGLQLKRLLQ